MISPEGLIPNLVPSAKIEGPRSLAPHEQVAPGEGARFNADLKRALTMVWGANRPLIDRDYADPEAISKETGNDKLSAEEIQKISADRKSEQEAARVVADKSKTAEAIRTEVSEQIRASDPHWKGVVPTDENKAEFDQAVTAEIERRNSLITMAETLYGVEDCRAAASQEFTAASDKKLSDKRAAAKAEALTVAQAKDSSATLSDAEIKKIEDETRLSEEEIAAIEEEVFPKYSPEERVFHKVSRVKGTDDTYTYTIDNGPDGKPIPIHEISAYQPLVVAVDDLISEQLDGKPTARAIEAKKLRETFKLNPDGKSFNLRSQERMNEIEALQDYDLVAEACGQEIVSLAESVGELLKPESDGGLFVVDANGKITAVNEGNLAKLQERLKGRKPDEKTYALYSLVQQLGGYLENRNDPNGADPDKGRRIATTLYYSLRSTVPNRLKVAFNKPDRFKESMQEIVKEMVNEYHIPYMSEAAMTSIMEKNPLRLLGLALTLREKQMMTTDARGITVPKNSKGLHQIIADWRLNDADTQFVYHFASSESLIETALQNNFGLDPNTLQDPEVQKRHIGQVLDHIVGQRVSDPENTDNVNKARRVYSDVLSDTLSDETLEKIRKEHKLGGVLKAIGMIALILGPGAQGILGLDVSDDEQKR